MNTAHGFPRRRIPYTGGRRHWHSSIRWTARHRCRRRCDAVQFPALFLKSKQLMREHGLTRLPRAEYERLIDRHARARRKSWI